jgi:DNA-directed RNA polymerase specialized sigma24 family protein
MEAPAAKGYLRTADTLLIDHWRREAEQTLESGNDFRKTDTGPRRFRRHVEAFRELKPQQRSLLWLAYVGGFDHREIAAAAG